MNVFAVLIEKYSNPPIVAEIVDNLDKAEKDLLGSGFIHERGLWIDHKKLRIAWIDRIEFESPYSSCKTTIHKTLSRYYCDACGSIVGCRWNYCQHCGAKLEWEDK